MAGKWLLEYPDRKRAHCEAMSEVSMLSAMVYGLQPTGTDIGRPCETKALKLTDLDEQRLWLDTIERVEKTLSPKKRAFLDLRRQADQMKCNRRAGRPGWVAYVQTQYTDWHLREYGVEFIPAERTLKLWWSEIVNVTVRMAIRCGCL